jgi:diacylglycerol kinase family enzyme
VAEPSRLPIGETASSPYAGQGWIGIVANRSSGIGRGRQQVARLVLALARAGLSTEIVWTPADRAALVQRAGRDSACRCLVAVGGDGTVSALLNERPSVPMSVFPAGTENLVARQFGLRQSAAALAGTITQGHPRRVDVGEALGRRFLLMVGFGFDGDIVTRHHNARVSRSGRIRPTSRLAYVEPVLRSSFSYQFPPITVRIENDGVPEILTGTTVFLFNSPRYALGLPFVPGAKDDDGWLDLLIFRDPGPFKALYYLWNVFRGTHLKLPSVFHRRVKSATVTANGTVPIQIDGDPAGFLLAGGDPAPAPAVSLRPAEPADDPAAGAGLGPISATAWTVEVVPQATLVYSGGKRRSGSHQQAALASDGRVR